MTAAHAPSGATTPAHRQYDRVSLDASPTGSLAASTSILVDGEDGWERRHRLHADVGKKVVVIDCDERETTRTETAPTAGQEIKPKLHSRAPTARIEFLNGLRGLAALLVVQQHANYMYDINLGACAVDTFFVLSAFLLTMLFERKIRQMLKHRADIRQWAIMLIDYFSKRFFRVYPLFAVTAIAVAALSPNDRARYFRVKNPEHYNLLEVLTFKFEARYHVFWTLPVEIGYYFLIPVFVFVMVALRRRWWLLAVPLYVWVIHEGIYKYRTSHFPLAPHIPTFLAGSLAAFVYARLDDSIKANGFEFAMWQRLVVRAVEGMFLCLALSIGFKGLFFHWVHENPVPPAQGFPFVSVPVTVVMVIEMLLPSALSRALEWNFLCYAGKVSFSMYLLHSFVIYSPYVSSEKTRYDLFFAQFGLIFLLSTTTYWLLEYPSQCLAQRISKKLNAWSLSYELAGYSHGGCLWRRWAMLASQGSDATHT